LLSKHIENMLNIKGDVPNPEIHMAFLLIIPAWLLLLSLVVGLCHAARLGDRQLQPPASRRTAGAPLARGVDRPDGVLVLGSRERALGLSPRVLS
jgi:hypothetical protein